MSARPDLNCESNAAELTLSDNENQLQEHHAFSDSVIINEDFLLDEDTIPYGEDEKIKTNIKSIFIELENALKQDITLEPSTDSEKIVIKRKLSYESDGEITDHYEMEEDSTPLATADTNQATEPLRKVLKLSERYPINVNDDIPEESTPKIIDDNVVNETANGKKLSQLSQMERLELRAQKFALNKNINAAQKQQPAEAEKAASTATTNSNNNPKTKRIIGGSVDINDPKQIELLKKRAVRFGCVVSSKMAQIVDAEKLQKRCERFGLENKAAAKTTIKATNKNNLKSKNMHARLGRLENKPKYRKQIENILFQPKSKFAKSSAQGRKQRR